MQEQAVRAAPAVPGPRTSTAGLAICVVTEVTPGAVLILTGRLDVRGAADVRTALVAAIESGHGELVLDLSAVRAIDATGLGVLVAAHRRAGRAGRSVVLRDPGGAVTRALLLTRLDRVLQLRRTPRSA